VWFNFQHTNRHDRESLIEVEKTDEKLEKRSTIRFKPLYPLFRYIVTASGSKRGKSNPGSIGEDLTNRVWNAFLSVENFQN
jgi:hypothetical protein